MDNFYFKIDETTLKMFSLPTQIYFKKCLLRDRKSVKYKIRSYYVRLCPYCGIWYLLATSETNNKINRKICSIFPINRVNNKIEPICCVFCGEENPDYKIRLSIDKASALFKMVKQFSKIHKTDDDRKKQRILLEQCLVILATGIELFFKEMYIIGMDFKYVKNDKTLFKKFYKDERNEFINIGKTNQKYKDDLNLDLKIILGDSLFKELNLLMLKRNVIVHNNGFVDKIFKESSGIKCKIHYPIPLSIREIKQNFKSVNSAIEKFQQPYNDLILPDFISKIDYKVNEVVDSDLLKISLG